MEPDWTDGNGETEYDYCIPHHPRLTYTPLHPEQEEGWKRNCEALTKRMEEEDEDV